MAANWFVQTPILAVMVFHVKDAVALFRYFFPIHRGNW